MRSGETLFVLENIDIEHAHKTAELELRAAETELERARKGVEAGFVASLELQKAELQHELALSHLEHVLDQRNRLTVLAPASGYLIVEEPPSS